MDTRCRIEMFGGLRIHIGERVITRFRTQKSASLLAYLAYFRHQSHPREVLIEILWPEIEPDVGRQRLSQALSSLRHQLEPPEVPTGAVIMADRFNVHLNSEAVATDVSDFLAALRSADRAKRSGSDTQRAHYLAHVIGLFRGELLPGFYDEWVVDEQNRLRTLYEQAEEALNQLSPAEPTSAGLPADADPTPPKLKPHTQQTHLPLQFTRFFGRDDELELLNRWCIGNPEDRTNHLITLTGPGGTGKTRLAIEAAGRLAETFPGGVWFVPLQDLSDPRLIPGTVLDALRLPRSPQAEPLHQVVEFLNGRASATLLLLDNMEHLLEAERRKAEDGAAVVRALLERCPSLTCLITSRQRLDLEGERDCPVLPLPVPGSVQEEGPQTPDFQSPRRPEDVIRFAGVQLFVDRAQCVKPDFQVTKGNAAAIAELCGRLEGVPLALELAASRAQVMTPRQMLSQLEHRFDFLVSSRRDVIDRHRTLRAAIEWSVRLLSPQLRRLFVGLSVFRGGWTVEAAEAVCDEPMALDFLAQLRDCSLIQTEEREGEIRFRMLETLREFAQGQMTPEERDNARRRHRVCFLRLAEAAEPHLIGAEQVAWMDRLEAEHDNLRSALAWSREIGGTDSETNLRLCGALVRFWWTRGHLHEGRTWMAEALSQAGSLERTQWRARALSGVGVLANLQGDHVLARAYHEESLSIRREIGDRQGMAISLDNLGTVAIEQGDYPAARTYFEESLAISREIGDRKNIAHSLEGLGRVSNDQGDYPAARTFYEQSVCIRREIGDRQGMAITLNNLAAMAKEQDDYPEARSCYEQCLTITRETGYRLGIAISLLGLGTMVIDQGDYVSARALLEESLSIFREIGVRRGIAASLLSLGYTACRQGDYVLARANQTECLSVSRESGDLSHISFSLEYFADLASVQERPEQSARLLGAAEAIREKIGYHLTPKERKDFDREVADARAKLDEEMFAARWAEGRAMSLQQAIAYALEEDHT